MRSSLFFGSVLLVLVSCSTQNSICSKQAECLGWNAAREDACQEELEGNDEVASEYDCEEAFGNYMNCVDETASCKVEQDGNKTVHKFDSNCGSQRDALESCEKAAREQVD